MEKKKQELKPDIILKNYWSNNEQFADLFNAVLFEGREVIKPEELEEVDTEESSIFEHREYAESLKASRDIIKVQKKSPKQGVQFVMLGLENQEQVHYAMPMRVMGYDYGCYKKQYDSNAKNYKTADGMTKAEYLSKMKKTDKFVPVITIVVYYGEQAWDGATSLHEMLNISEEMKPYVSEHKMLLVEARENNLILHNMNNQDLFNLLQIILDRSVPRKEAKEKVIQYGEKHKTDKSVIMAVAGATNTKLDYVMFERSSENMCTLFEEIAEEGRIEGKAEGRIEGEKIGRTEGEKLGGAKQIVEMGREFNLSDNDILERLQKKLNLSLQVAQEYLQQFGKQIV